MSVETGAMPEPHAQRNLGKDIMNLGKWTMRMMLV